VFCTCLYASAVLRFFGVGFHDACSNLCLLCLHCDCACSIMSQGFLVVIASFEGEGQGWNVSGWLVFLFEEVLI
jgi:hypothetical protein